MNVDFALDVHEHQSTREADGHHYQLGPERPLQDSWSDRGETEERARVNQWPNWH